MSIADEQKAALAATQEARKSKAPQCFDYSAEEAVARAKDGSVLDARILLALAAKLLRQRGPVAPFDQSSLVPGWLADYLADALDSIVQGADAGKALHVSRRRGRSKYEKEHESKMLMFYLDQIAEANKALAEKFPRRYANTVSKQRQAELSGLSERTLRRKRQAAKK